MHVCCSHAQPNEFSLYFGQDLFTKLLVLFLQYVLALSTPEGYQGYGPEQGQMVMCSRSCRNIYTELF
jgi:hypothetical protein